jgi:hypothetical protein
MLPIYCRGPEEDLTISSFGADAIFERSGRLMIVTGIAISAPLALTRAPRPSARAVRFTTRRCLFSCEPDIGAGMK